MGTAAQLIAEGEISDWQKKMLDLRWEEYLSDKTTFTSWEDFKKELDNEERLEDITSRLP
jgi:hypothetical protein